MYLVLIEQTIPWGFHWSKKTKNKKNQTSVLLQQTLSLDWGVTMLICISSWVNKGLYSHKFCLLILYLVVWISLCSNRSFFFFFPSLFAVEHYYVAFWRRSRLSMQLSQAWWGDTRLQWTYQNGPISVVGDVLCCEVKLFKWRIFIYSQILGFSTEDKIHAIFRVILCGNIKQMSLFFCVF